MAVNEITTGQFVTALIAVAAAATGLLTLFLSNRRLRAERALPAFQVIRARVGGAEVEIQNVGARTCVDVVLVTSGDATLVAGALQPGERITIGIPIVVSVDVVFRDVAGTRRIIRRYIEWNDGRPSMALPPKRGWLRRLGDRLGLTYGD